jgi:hypothetical protein
VKTLLAAGSPRLHDFASSFTSIAEAYRTGAMAYGMIVGQKPAAPHRSPGSGMAPAS